MMFGTRDTFDYLECSGCGCLQLVDPPPDFSKYYPPDYYSFQRLEPEAEPQVGRSLKERFVTRQIADYRLKGKGHLGRWFESRHPYCTVMGDLPYWLKARDLKLRTDSKILDVGCGSGYHLLELRRQGFANLWGVDPYVASDISYKGGPTILKASLAEMKGGFDLVMLHHSFEHMAQPRQVMGEVYRLLKRGRYALIRVPLAGSYAWRTYGVNWVQLDAPRHLFLHTPRSLGALAAEAGFRVAGVVYDSTAAQFVGSEQYCRDIPLSDPRSFLVNPPGSLFSGEEWQEFEARAAELNEAGDGDQACFYLYKP